MADVATTKLFENDKVIVWEMVLPPGDRTGVHTHRQDCFVLVLAGSTVEALDADGNVLTQMTMPTGMKMSMRIQGDALVADEGSFPATHEARNVGDSPYREMLIEFK